MADKEGAKKLDNGHDDDEDMKSAKMEEEEDKEPMEVMRTVLKTC